ncbi:MAG: hypothetical protein Q8L48_38800 [Archangium sp.]|nr:hypothetical protein [Archangium sp.]
MYELFLPQMVSSFEVPSQFDDWRHGKPLESRPRTIQAKYSGTRPLPQLFRSITPFLHRDVITFLRDKGADNLETTEAVIEVPGQESLEGWFATNVVGRISLAAFFAHLPPVDSFPERRRDGVRSAMNDVASLVERVTLVGQGLPKPTAVIARLAEHNRPLLIRSDVARELEARQFSGLELDDVRFCSLYVGTGFYQLMADAAPR